LDKPRQFRNSKQAQDAHEAIRPTSVFNTPDKMAPYLTQDQLALYQLIWQRFIASQMQEALINQVSASIVAGPYVFTASGSSMTPKRACRVAGEVGGAASPPAYRLVSPARTRSRRLPPNVVPAQRPL
jgi:DNA topoisomerase-1